MITVKEDNLYKLFTVDTLLELKKLYAKLYPDYVVDIDRELESRGILPEKNS